MTPFIRLLFAAGVTVAGLLSPALAGWMRTWLAGLNLSQLSITWYSSSAVEGQASIRLYRQDAWQRLLLWLYNRAREDEETSQLLTVAVRILVWLLSTPVGGLILGKRLEELAMPNFERAAGLTAELPPPGLRPYREAAAAVPESLVAELASLQRSLGRRTLDVPIDTNRAAASQPWEAMLHLALPAAFNGLPGGNFLLWRVGPRRPRQPAVPWESRQILGLNDGAWAGMVQSGWEPLSQHVTTAADREALKTAGQATIVHLCGTPLQTDRRVCVQIGSHRSAQFSKQAAAGPESEPFVVSADDVQADVACLVVVQAEPAPLLPRTEDDRRQAGRLRDFAAELVVNGERAVLVLPRLPSDLAEAVLRDLAQNLDGGTPPDRQRYLVAMRAVQLRIAAAVGEAPDGSSPLQVQSVAPADDALERAMDVCLYLADQRGDAGPILQSAAQASTI